jgi:hypothetical protein
MPGSRRFFLNRSISPALDVRHLLLDVFKVVDGLLDFAAPHGRELEFGGQALQERQAPSTVCQQPCDESGSCRTRPEEPCSRCSGSSLAQASQRATQVGGSLVTSRFSMVTCSINWSDVRTNNVRGPASLAGRACMQSESGCELCASRKAGSHVLTCGRYASSRIAPQPLDSPEPRRRLVPTHENPARRIGSGKRRSGFRRQTERFRKILGDCSLPIHGRRSRIDTNTSDWCSRLIAKFGVSARPRRPAG